LQATKSKFTFNQYKSITKPKWTKR